MGLLRSWVTAGEACAARVNSEPGDPKPLLEFDPVLLAGMPPMEPA